MKIVVLGGGISTERNVSLVTATSVCKALRTAGHQAVFVDSFLGLEDYNKDLSDIFEEPDGMCTDVKIDREEPDLSKVWAMRKNKSASRIGDKVLDACALADCVFIGLHGLDGEDGKIQALLDLYGIPYTGSDSISSANAMDKSMTKKIMDYAGIPNAPWKEYFLDEASIFDIVNETSLPCVVKVVNGGSSIGVFICDTNKELEEALSKASALNSHIIIEKKIVGREFAVAILDNQVLTPIEIIPPDGGSFDYVSKYQSGSDAAREICPADITGEQKKILGDLALKLYNALGLSVYSRADIILDENNNGWCLEMNTLPGMTGASLLPKAANDCGYDYPALCDTIVKLSMKK